MRLANCGCLNAGDSNSCYWDFLRQHVNKRRALEPAPACPLASESGAPQLESANSNREEGGSTEGGGQRMEEEGARGAVKHKALNLEVEETSPTPNKDSFLRQ